MMTTDQQLVLPNGSTMPTVGLGTWQSTNEAELESALNFALECGYRHIDTAYFYNNEAIIGRVLKEWISSEKITREDLFITTKLPMFAIRADCVEQYLKKSLENLQLEYVDLYLIHFSVCLKYAGDGAASPFVVDEEGYFQLEKTDHVAVWKEMEHQVDAGRTKCIGLSNFNIRQISNVLEVARIKPANLQVEISVFLQQRDLMDYCKANDITVVAYSPLGSPGYNKFMVTIGKEPVELPDILGNSTIGSIAQKHGKTPAQIALRFLVQRGIAVIPKSVTLKRLKENIDIFDFALSDEDMEDLTSLDVGEKARVCDFRVFKGIEQHEEFPF